MRRHLFYGIVAGVLLAAAIDDGRRRRRRDNSRPAGGSAPPAATPTNQSRKGRSPLMKAFLAAKAFGTRKRAIITSVAVTALLCAGAAVAAFIIYSGLSGSAGGKVSGSSTVGALSFSPAPDTIPVSGPGSSGSLDFTVTNADPAHSESVSSVTAGTITTDTVGCPGSNFTANVAPLVGFSVAAGATVTNSLTAGLTLSAGAPSACAGATVTVPLTGTTTTGP